MFWLKILKTICCFLSLKSWNTVLNSGLRLQHQCKATSGLRCNSTWPNHVHFNFILQRTGVTTVTLSQSILHYRLGISESSYTLWSSGVPTLYIQPLNSPHKKVGRKIMSSLMQMLHSGVSFFISFHENVIIVSHFHSPAFSFLSYKQAIRGSRGTLSRVSECCYRSVSHLSALRRY